MTVFEAHEIFLNKFTKYLTDSLHNYLLLQHS